MKKNRIIIFISLLFSIAAIAALPFHPEGLIYRIIAESFDYAAVFFMLFYLTAELTGAIYKKQYLIRNLFTVIFIIIYTIVFITLKLLPELPEELKTAVFTLRGLFLIFKAVEEIRSVRTLILNISEHPAGSILLSFQLVIITGTLLLMLPFASADGRGLNFIDSWFTATSAVCVTGLIVVDTAVYFSFWGKLIILVLIQIGGLGIMIMSYFSAFILRRKMSFTEKRRLSFAISDNDYSGIIRQLKSIIYLTFTIEAVGALVLFAGLGRRLGYTAGTLFNAVFHSISAFCNAGFSLFSNSLEDFYASPLVILTVSLLIIIGGLSFAVIINIGTSITGRKKGLRLSINSRIVLIWSVVLIITGMYLFYGTEHRNTLLHLKPGEQLLAAFFQSVTLRTAGFNSVPFSGLTTGTLLIMCFFMFTGGASGSTAGGIKVNTMAVLTSYIKSLFTGSPRTTIYRYQLSKTNVLRAFSIFQYGLTAVFLGVVGLVLTQDLPLDKIIFETVSAFGTVGLSAGITSALNTPGKLIIILLMFNGRIGPLTIIASFSNRQKTGTIQYPQADISIG